MPVHTMPLTERHADRGPSRALTLSAQEAAELAARGFRFAIYRPEEGEFRLSLPLQTIEDRVGGTITIEQG